MPLPSQRSLRPLIFVAVGLAWAGAGFFAGRISVESASTLMADTVMPVVPESTRDFGATDVEAAQPIEPTLVERVRAIAGGAGWQLNKEWELIINGLGPDQIPPLLDALAGHRDTPACRRMHHALFSRWAEEAPRAALERARGSADQAARNRAIESVFHGWAYANATQFEGWAAALPRNPEREQAFTALARQWAESDPRRAFRLAVEAELPRRSPGEATRMLALWGATDPAGAIAEARRTLPDRLQLPALAGIAQSWAERDPAAAWAWAGALPETEAQVARDAVMRGWIQIDSAGATARVLALPAGPGRDHAVRSVTQSWIQQDAPAAVRWLLSLPADPSRDSALAQGVMQLAHTAPAEALDLLDSLPLSGPLTHMTSATLGALAKSSPETVLAFAERMTGNARRDALVNIFNQLAQADPARALDLAEHRDLGAARSSVVANLMGNLARTDPEAAINRINDLTQPMERNRALAQVAISIAQEDPDLATVIAASLPPGGEFQHTLGQVAALYARRDPAAALAWAESLPAGNGRENAVGQVTQAWAQQDLPGAVRWLSSLPPTEVTPQSAQQIGQVWVNRDPAGFAASVQAMPPGPLRESLLVHVGWQLTHQNPELAQHLVETLSAGPDRDQFTANVIGNLAQQAPQVAAALALRQAAGPGRDQAIQSLLGNWSHIDPQATADWLVSHAEVATPQSYAQVATQWLHFDPDSAVAWISALPAGAVRDAVLQTGTQQLIGRDPAGAARLLAHVSEPSQYLNLGTHMAHRWLAIDPAAARAWIATSDLPPEVKTDLLARTPNP